MHNCLPQGAARHGCCQDRHLGLEFAQPGAYCQKGKSTLFDAAWLDLTCP